MTKTSFTVAIVVIALAQVALTYWNWEQTAAMKGQFVCNISDKLAGQVIFVMVDRYTPVNDPGLVPRAPLANGTFYTSRVIRKMTPFLPALDVYHKCFDGAAKKCECTTKNCACYMKFRLGPKPGKGEFAPCVSLGRQPQRLGWEQRWCNFGIVDLQAYTNATCYCES
ncbi:hypothetical protein AAVH_07215 [Aphelenchoides avenae]|nr:hypothetical protein AAVH_07215 [Aphelenchus avenae]